MCHFIRRLALLGAIVLAFGLLMPTQAIAQEESPFSAEELAYIQNADTLKIGYVQDRIPVSFRDENWRGFPAISSTGFPSSAGCRFSMSRCPAER